MKQREVTLFNMALLFVFWLALGILKVCHGNETIASSTPAYSDNSTHAAESTPASSESVTRAAESTPASSESVTRAAESTPASSESVTRAAESTPASSDSTKPVASITPASRNSLTPTISATGISKSGVISTSATDLNKGETKITPAVLASLTFIGGVLITIIFGFVVFSCRRHRRRQIHPPKDNENTISLDDASAISHNQIVAFMRPPFDHHRDTQGPKMSSDMTAEYVNDSKDNDYSVLHPTGTSIQEKQYPSNEGNHCEDFTVYNEVGEVREYMSVIDETDVNTVVAATRL